MGVLKITKGKQKSAVRVCIYGTEGIGKTTLASQFPAPLILDTEDGTRMLDVARVAIPDWKTLTLAVAELTVSPQGFKTVVIDSADWAERLLIEWMVKAAGKKSIEDFGFGKGYTILAEHWGTFLSDCDNLIAAGLNVVFVAHSTVKRTSPPDQTDGYDRYELKLSKQTSPLIREWSDALLFANFKTRLIDGADGRKKATGGKTRVMYAERSAAWDAKNRYGLAEELPMTIEALAPLFDGGQSPAAAPAKPKLRDRIAAANSTAALGEIADEIEQLESDGKLTAEQVATLTKLIDERDSFINHQEPANA